MGLVTGLATIWSSLPPPLVSQKTQSCRWARDFGARELTPSVGKADLHPTPDQAGPGSGPRSCTSTFAEDREGGAGILGYRGARWKTHLVDLGHK